jgi:hypothetical protein
VPPPDQPSKLPAAVLAHARRGLSRVEIASALGIPLAALEARAAADPALTEALVLGDQAAEAWWLGLPRALLANGKSLNGAAWRAAMDWRFGGQGQAGRGAGQPASGPALGPIVWTSRGPVTRDGRPLTAEEREALGPVKVYIPRNGREVDRSRGAGPKGARGPR